MSSAALGMMYSCTIRHWKRKQENLVIPSGLTAGLTLPIGSDLVQGIRGEQGKAIRIEGICKGSQKVCFLGRLVSNGREDRQVAALFLYR